MNSLDCSVVRYASSDCHDCSVVEIVMIVLIVMIVGAFLGDLLGIVYNDGVSMAYYWFKIAN